MVLSTLYINFKKNITIKGSNMQINETTEVPTDLTELFPLFVLEDGETYTGGDIMGVVVTKQELDRIEAGEKVSHVVDLSDSYTAFSVRRIVTWACMEMQKQGITIL